MNVTTTLRTALRQLEAEKGRLERQIGAVRGALDGAASSPTPVARRRGQRRSMTTAQRQALSRRMKAYWAKRRAQALKATVARRSARNVSPRRPHATRKSAARNVAKQKKAA